LIFFPFFDKKYTKTNGRNVKNSNPFFTAPYTTTPIQNPIRDALTILFDCIFFFSYSNSSSVNSSNSFCFVCLKLITHYPLSYVRSEVLTPLFYETLGGKTTTLQKTSPTPLRFRLMFEYLLPLHLCLRPRYARRLRSHELNRDWIPKRLHCLSLLNP
jgi:hypothetical protein